MAFAGKDFPSFFEKDLFALRRSGTAFAAGNPYDPESLLTGAEMAEGLDYNNSRRDWPSEALYTQAVGGEMPSTVIAVLAPRKPLKGFFILAA